MGRALSSSWQGKFAVFVQPNCLREIVMSPSIQRLKDKGVNCFTFQQQQDAADKWTKARMEHFRQDFTSAEECKSRR